ncbi:MAG: hypothetical protein ACRC7G_07995 [Beijerinckiaceae bacterium]
MRRLRALAAIICIAGLALPANAQQRPAPLPAPVIIRDLEALPSAVRRMRALILDAMRSGEVESLRLPIETNEVPPSFARQKPRAAAGVAMATELLRIFSERSGDGRGRETMGQVINLLAVGAARVSAGRPQEMYVWPYFSTLDPRLLTPEQQVDVHRVLSAHALAEWREKGRYPGWRLGIGPDGTWHYLLGAE